MSFDWLSAFDFIIDWWSKSQNEACHSAILYFMGINDAQVNKTNAADPKYKADFSRSSYELMNALDTQVYKYAVKLMKVDCDFFLGLRAGTNMETDMLG